MGFAKQPPAMRLNKVPQVTLAFWAIKIMSTTVGETGADYLAVHVGLGSALTDGITMALLATALIRHPRPEATDANRRQIS